MIIHTWLQSSLQNCFEGPTVSNKKPTPRAVEHPQATSDTHAKFATGKRYKLTLQGLVHPRQIHAKMAHDTDHPSSWRKALSSLLHKSFPPSVIKLQLCRSVPDCPSKQDISPTHEIRDQTFIIHQTPSEVSSPSTVS